MCSSPKQSIDGSWSSPVRPIDSSIAVVEAGDSAHTVAARFRVPDAAPVPDLPDDPERPVCICFTSGSTGQPRGGWYANRQFQAIADLDTGGAWGGGGHGLSSVAMAHVGFMTKFSAKLMPENVPFPWLDGREWVEDLVPRCGTDPRRFDLAG